YSLHLLHFLIYFFFLLIHPPPKSPLFPYTTLFRSKTRDIFNRPRHPYAVGLLDCLPTLRRGREPLTAIEGQPPDLANVPAGCSFTPRCPMAEPRCSEKRPPLEPVDGEHLVACIRAGE